MKVALDQKLLTKKIQGISSVVPTKSSLPILSTFLMEAKNGKVHMTANDLDVSLTTMVDCEVEEEGQIAVPGRKFFEIVRSLPEDTVRLESSGEKISIKCLKSRFRMVGKAADEFPKLPKQKSLGAFDMRSETVNDMVQKTIYAVSTDLTRPALCGVLWQVENGAFSMVATDGHRLSKVVLSGDYSGIENRDFIVSPKALNILRSLLDGKDEVGITLAENHITFDLGDNVIYSRLLEGPFPDYKQVIPKNNEKELVVNREELTAACRRVAILSSVITHQIRLSIGSDSLTISVNTPDVGEAVEEVHCHFKSEPMEIGYNARYLLDILKAIDTDDVSFLLDRSDSAGMLVPVGGAEEVDYRCLLMPLRLNE
ncbi:MAG: DNA polymerase III subunit beta [Candidatus Krumholzibacteria bacterium]|nr:DNA polymerase III subunit beta [Candidatus Krumholzibacteria bacterium]